VRLEPRHETYLEPSETERAAGLACQPRNDFVPPPLERVGGLKENPLPLRRRLFRPRRKCLGGSLDGTSRIFAAARRNPGDGLAGEGVDVVERLASLRIAPPAADWRRAASACGDRAKDLRGRYAGSKHCGLRCLPRT